MPFETNPEAIDSDAEIKRLVGLLSSIQDENTRTQVIEDLENIDPGYHKTIKILLQMLSSSDDEYRCWQVVESLEKIDPDNQDIKELLQELDISKPLATDIIVGLFFFIVAIILTVGSPIELAGAALSGPLLGYGISDYRKRLLLKHLKKQANEISRKLEDVEQHVEQKLSQTRRTDETSSPFIISGSNITNLTGSGSINYINAGGEVQSNNPLPFVYIHAEMYDIVLINHATTVEVIVSRELLNWAENEAAKTGKAEIDETRKLLIQVIPKMNVELLGEDRVEVEPPASNNPHHFYFDLRATNVGNGEVWVIARQGQIPLTTLKLYPQIVQNRTEVIASQRTSKNSSIFNAPVLSEPLHQLFITEQRNGNDIFYRYEILSPSLNIIGCYTSEKVTANRNEYITHFYEEIENRWLNSQDDVEAFTAELRAFGGELCDQLFPIELQEILWLHRTSINSIMVISDEPFIPWELVHLKPPRQSYLPDEIRFLGQMGLIRWLYDVGWPPEHIKIRKHRVHYIIPHYPIAKYRLLEAEQEYQFLEERFQATPIEAQPNPVRNLLSTPGAFDLLHFACHGEVEHKEIAHAKLLLDGYIRGNEYFHAHLTSTTIGQYCNMKADDNRPMIILNACQVGRSGYALTGISGFAHAFIEGGCGAFIGPLWSVSDRTARIFIETLYAELLDGRNLAQATINARSQAQQAGDATWLAYAVYGHPHLKIITSE